MQREVGPDTQDRLSLDDCLIHPWAEDLGFEDALFCGTRNEGVDWSENI